MLLSVLGSPVIIVSSSSDCSILPTSLLRKVKWTNLFTLFFSE